VGLVIAGGVAAQLGGAEHEDLNAVRERIQQLTPSQKEDLRRKKERFDQLPDAERERLREFHLELDNDALAGRLQQIMLRYHDWLRSLPSEQRAELQRLPQDQRIVEIKKIMEQQEKQRFHELVMKRLHPEDYDVILAWLDEWVLSELTPEQKTQLAEQSDPRSRRREMFGLYRKRLGDQAPRFPDVILPDDQAIQNLAAKLSDEPRTTLQEAPDVESRRFLVKNWIGAALFSRTTPRVTAEELKKFLEKQVDPARRDYLENLPRDRMLSELRRMYFMDRFRGKGGERPFGKRPPGDFRGPGEKPRESEPPYRIPEEKQPPPS
jgi:hypothetical protein